MPALSSSLYTPLMIAAILCALLYVLSQVLQARGRGETGERVLDLSFAIAMCAGAWTIVLLAIAVFDEADLVWDMIVVIFVVVGFFGLLLLAGFAAIELLFSRGRRRSPEPGD